GNPQEPRNIKHFGQLQAKVVGHGLEGNFRFLGNVPYRHVAVLMRSCVAMLNPSLFEGWSTTVEEAKSLGVRMLVSDLRVHREQLGQDAESFDPYDPQAIAASLQKAWSEFKQPATLLQQQAAAAAAEVRIREFAQDFARACTQAIDRERAR